MIIEYLNLNLSDAEKAEIGFRFDDNNNLYFNGIHFSRYIAGSCPLLYCIEEKEYYIYEDGYYKWVKSYGLKKELRKAFIKYSKDVWPKNHHENYLSNLKYEANSISDITSVA